MQSVGRIGADVSAVARPVRRSSQSEGGRAEAEATCPPSIDSVAPGGGHALAFAPLRQKVAVGTLIAERPPHRSVRAAFPHTAPTSGDDRALQEIAVRGVRRSACGTLVRLRVRDVLCCFTFPLVPTLGSTSSAANCSALFASFTATMASPDFPPPYIIGYGSSPSRCGPPASSTGGQTRDLPGSNTILLRVMCSPAPAGCAVPRMAVLRMLRSAAKTTSAPSDKGISRLNHTPHATTVYASRPPLPAVSRNTRFQAVCCTLPGLDFHQPIAPAFPGAP